MRFKRKVSPLRKKAQRGFKGYPGATVIWYGPDDTRATKVAVGIVHGEAQPPTAMKRWYGEEGDLRNDLTVAEEIRQFLELHGAKSVVMSDGIMGCPHEEGIDYPDGQVCPECPFWARQDVYSDLLQKAKEYGRE
jgi:hypothetical protein